MNFKLSILFLYLFLQIIEKTKNKSSTIEVKFNKYNSIQSNDIILSNFNNDIYISLKVGNPHQNIEKIFLKSDTYELMISNKTIDKNNYEKSESNTCKIISLPQYYSLKYTYKGYILKDHFYLDNKENNQLMEIQNITFIYANMISNNLYTAVIGFQLDENGVKKSKTFPEQLQELKYIKDSTWMIKYNTENEGYFYLGDILNDEVFPKFNIQEYRKTNAIMFGYYLSWDFLFSQIEFNDIKLGGPLQANLNINFGLISCTNETYKSIKNEFFNQYINNKICQELFFDGEDKNNKIKNINSKFNYIVCDKSLKIKNFPTIYFYHTELDFVFELTYEDLFIKSDDKIYFLCINEIKNYQRWVFGKPFFKKYNIIFDHNSKTIALYGNNTKGKTNWILFEWIVVILLFIIFLILLYTLIRRYRLNHYKSFEKKIKSDELNNTIFEEKEYYKNLSEMKPENKIIDDKIN